jgi:hypothetical protein
MNKNPEKKTVDQLALEAMHAFMARTLLLLSTRSRAAADQLCTAHLQYERPAPNEQ